MEDSYKTIIKPSEETLFKDRNSNFFFDIAYIFDFSSNSKYEYQTSQFSITNAVKLETVQNIALGIGYKVNKKFSLETRYQTSRNLFKHSNLWLSNYRTYSVILGYTLF